MNDSALTSALGALLVDQPDAPDRLAAVRRRERHRRQVQLASLGAVAVVATAGVAALLPAGGQHKAVPAADRGFLPWAPRTSGHEAELQAAYLAWVATLTTGPSDLRPLYAGTPRGSGGLVWTVFEARVGGAVRLVVSRTAPTGGPVLVSDAPGPRSAFAVSAVEQRVTGVPPTKPAYVGAPGSTDRTTVFVLPAPEVDAVGLRALQGPRPVPAGIELGGPFVEQLSGVAQPVELSAGDSSSRWVRAGSPPAYDVNGQPLQPEVLLPPIPVPAGYVRGGTTSGHQSGGGFAYGYFLKGRLIRVLVRCTNFGDGPLEVSAVTPSGREVGRVVCDGGVHDAFGHDIASVAAGSTSFSWDGPEVDEVRFSAVFRR